MAQAQARVYMLVAAVAAVALVQPGAADMIFTVEWEEDRWARGADGSLAVGWAAMVALLVRLVAALKEMARSAEEDVAELGKEQAEGHENPPVEEGVPPDTPAAAAHVHQSAGPDMYRINDRMGARGMVPVMIVPPSGFQLHEPQQPQQPSPPSGDKPVKREPEPEPSPGDCFAQFATIVWIISKTMIPLAQRVKKDCRARTIQAAYRRSVAQRHYQNTCKGVAVVTRYALRFLAARFSQPLIDDVRIEREQMELEDLGLYRWGLPSKSVNMTVQELQAELQAAPGRLLQHAVQDIRSEAPAVITKPDAAVVAMSDEFQDLLQILCNPALPSRATAKMTAILRELGASLAALETQATPDFTSVLQSFEFLQQIAERAVVAAIVAAQEAVSKQNALEDERRRRRNVCQKCRLGLTCVACAAGKLRRQAEREVVEPIEAEEREAVVRLTAEYTPQVSKAWEAAVQPVVLAAARICAERTTGGDGAAPDQAVTATSLAEVDRLLADQAKKVKAVRSDTAEKMRATQSAIERRVLEIRAMCEDSHDIGCSFDKYMMQREEVRVAAAEEEYAEAYAAAADAAKETQVPRNLRIEHLQEDPRAAAEPFVAAEPEPEPEPEPEQIIP